MRKRAAAAKPRPEKPSPQPTGRSTGPGPAPVTKADPGAAQLEPHEVATIFPPMGAEEYEALKKDIAANGLLDPVVVHEGKVVDGLNRLRACR